MLFRLGMSGEYLQDQCDVLGIESGAETVQESKLRSSQEYAGHREASAICASSRGLIAPASRPGSRPVSVPPRCGASGE